MNIRCVTFFSAFSIVSLLGAAEIPIEFSGVLTAGGKTRLALTDTVKKTTTWVEAGEVFNGYTVVRYDSKEDAIFVRKGGQETRIGLVAAKTAESRATEADTSPSTQAATNAIRSNLRLLASTARQYQIAHGVNTVSYADLVGPDKLIKELKPVAGENYSTLNFGPNVTGVSVTTMAGATVSMELPPAAPVNAAGPTSTQPVPSASPLPTIPAIPSPGAPANAATPAPTTPPPTAATAEAMPSTNRQPASPSYTIQGGDTWQKISESTGVSIPQLKQMNPTLGEGNSLPAGQTIRIR